MINTVVRVSLPWQDEYNKQGKITRSSCWLVDHGCSCSCIYGNRPHDPSIWPSWIEETARSLEHKLGIDGELFNSVNCNKYATSKEDLQWHADDEKELGENPIVGSVNFGATRDFIIRTNDKAQKISIPLKHGTLLIMSGKLQHFLQHSVPKRKKVKDVRFNLTFRVIKN